jgi:glycerol-3-phosphate dehydrogenase (NAD(P)+)
MTKTFQHFGIIGAGAWGTALAATLGRAGRDVTLWAHNPDIAEAVNSRHENTQHLPGLALDPAIRATHDLSVFGGADALIFAMPAQRLRAIAQGLKAAAAFRNAPPVVIAAKGIELGTSKMLSEVAAEEMPGHGLAVLSGPSFAREVAKGRPTALTLATRDAALGKNLMRSIATPAFRPYQSDDLIGAQLGGAIKNVMAIACGIITGKNLGENARAALITRGLAEIMRLGAALGARPETLMGLSGAGDLMLTCSSPQSRNMSLGIALGRGEALDAILAGRTSVAEGVPTAAAALELAERLKVDMPIVEAVAAVLKDALGVDQAIIDLLARPLKDEAK